MIAAAGAAFLAGLAGSVHCLGMCGGISGALALASAARQRWLAPVLNSGGRITSYTLAGGLAGAIGAGMTRAGPGVVGPVLTAVTALLFLSIGIGMLVQRPGLAWIEGLGARAWGRVAPLARRSLSLRGPLGAWVGGMLWGFLPCGLVYTMLAAAAASGSALQGMVMMAAFGAGTATAVVAAGISAGPGAGWLRARSQLRKPAALLLIAFAAWTAWPLLAPGGGHDHGHGHHTGALPAASVLRESWSRQ
ncbi:MAG: sulfite exporter TauE/SafE family protein [Chromatiales bacterium]|nr:sulfite exporter TauE/SafE family protein [Chromatiales bacterium]